MNSIRQTVSLSEIEDMCGSVSSTDTGWEAVRIPSSLRYGGAFGVPVALIQLLATWARCRPESELKLYPSTDLNIALEKLASKPHGMAALYFSHGIADYSNNKIPTREALEYAIPYIRAMQDGRYHETMHGRGIFLGCFGAAKNEYISPLYARRETGYLRGRDDFETLTRTVISTVAPMARKDLTDGLLSAVSNLIYELFRNTDEHARTDEEGMLYVRNMRGLMVKAISVDGALALNDANSGDIPNVMFMLRNSLSRKRYLAEDGKKRLPPTATFLELTVFDTGPGLARRWLSKQTKGASLDELDIDEETELVQKCFQRHASTKDGDGSGHGLDLVVGVLSKLRAFLRLRTGRVCLYQDFSSTAMRGFSPSHWNKDKHKLGVVAGAAYSIIIPLSRLD